jgi:RNA polymerase sigma factor (sigma-70 family)
MAGARLTPVLHHIRRLAGVSEGPDASDARLLERFALARDPDAFAALVRRHGPLVWRVCRRVLAHAQDAEDAFQATFLVLSRKASSVRRPAALASWLHGVAYHVARNARARRDHPVPPGEEAVDPAAADPGHEAAWRELGRLIEAEVHALPEEYRLPLLLCYWEGKTNEEAARQLGWPCGTVKTRLARARRLLHGRLAGRGVTLSAGVVATLLAPAGATAAVPAALLAATARAALGTGAAAGGGVSTGAAALAGGARGLAEAKVKVGMVLALAAGVLAAGAGALAHQLLAAKPTAAKQEAEPEGGPQIADGPRGDRQAHTDRYGDPLPPGALVRLGTVRLRHGPGVYSVAFAPDGKTLASTGGDGRVRLWDPATGKEVRQLDRRPQHEATFAVFAPDGKTLAAGGPQERRAGAKAETRPVYLWDVATGREVRRLPGHEGSLCSAAFAPDGKLLAAATQEGVVRFWDLPTGKELRRVRGGGGSIAFSPDGKLLASAGGSPRFAADGKERLPGGGDIRIWEVATGRQVRRLAGDQGAVTAVAFAAGGKTLASGSEDGTVRLWQVRTGKELRTLTHGQPRTDRTGGVPALAFSPDGSVLASGGADGTVLLWDAASGKPLRRLTGHRWWVFCLAFAPDGKTLASGSWDGTVRLWDPATGAERLPFDEHQSWVRAALSPDGSLLATGSADGTLRLWDPATGKRRLRCRGHEGGIRCVTLSPDGRALASGGGDMVVRLWDVVTGREVRQLEGHEKARSYDDVSSVAFSPDGKVLASAGSHDRTIRIWDTATGRELRRVRQDGTSAAVFSPDGKTLAAGGWDGKIHLWDVGTGKEVRVIEPQRDSGGGPPIINSVAFSPDGRTLASGSHDETVRLWDVATGAERRRLKGHQGVVWSVAFSPDGKLVASGSRDETVRLWEVATGQEVHRLRGHSGWVLSVAFSPDGKVLVSGGNDSTALVWTLSPTAARGQAGAKVLGPADLERLWADLAGRDAARAYRAGWALVEEPAKAVAFLRGRLRPVVLADARRVRRLIADLDADDFAVREAASRGLAQLGAEAEPALRAALAGKPSAEVRRRVKDLLAEPVTPTPAALRDSRAVQALERIGTAEARRVLAALAGGERGGRLTEEARAALGRLARRTAP